MNDNLFCKEQKISTKKYRKNWKHLFKRKVSGEKNGRHNVKSRVRNKMFLKGNINEELYKTRRMLELQEYFH